jgi:hypothetical protein
MCESDVSVCECTTDTQCNNGLFCDGVETCDLTTNTCINGIVETCNDGELCTSDTCDQ